MAKLTNQLRIIGGQWRGRKIQFEDLPTLRPTSDRVRETLFNWLAYFIPGSQCLDAFAGSGALGFEALSRGAKKITMLDQNPKIIHRINESIEKLNCKQWVDLIQTDSIKWLKQQSEVSYDIIFLDPPYQSRLLLPSCNLIKKNQMIKPNGYIYIETDKNFELSQLPKEWKLIKHKKASQVVYNLFKNTSE